MATQLSQRLPPPNHHHPPSVGTPTSASQLGQQQQQQQQQQQHGQKQDPQQRPPPPPQSQQQHPHPPQSPLLLLPSMFHAVLCQTADVFNSPARQHSRAVMYTNAQLNASIPALHDRFHFGLDLLEMDIVRAKAALRRDLNRIQAQRRAQEEAEAAERRKAEEAEEARKRAEEEAEARKKAAEEEERRRAEEEEEAARQRKEGEAAAERIRKQQEEARKVDPIVIQDDIPPLSAQQISAGGVSAEGTFDFWMEDAPAPDSATAQEFSMDMGFPGSSHSHPEIPGMSMEDPVPQAQGSFAEFMASMPMLGPPGDGNGGGMNGGENDHGDSVGDDGLSSYDDLFNFGL